ncbi:hypothetical protein [Lactiplantibacillus paraplantarum]|uniref:hypothetical protein n=1 Tax=Lactiplantibacillus paraplantarum TaxID=60520 RepID=UPI003DA659A5
MENGGWYDIADPDVNDWMQTASKLNYQLNYGDATHLKLSNGYLVKRINPT